MRQWGGLRAWAGVFALAALGLGVEACASSESNQTFPSDAGDASLADATSGSDATKDATADTSLIVDTGSEPACAPSQMCDGGCVDLQHDPANCGMCGHACGVNQVCSVGMCTYMCNPPEQL